MRLIIRRESDSGREDEKRGGAVRDGDVSGSDSSASGRDGQDETRAELTARSQLQCEAECMLGATAACGQYSVNTGETRVCQHTQHTNLSVKANLSANY